MKLRTTFAPVLLAAVALVPALGCGAGDAEESVGESDDAVKRVPSLNAPAAGAVTFARDEEQKQRFIPIDKKSFGKAKVLFSVKLADVTTAESILLRAEFTLSTCGTKDISGDASDGEKNPCSTPELKKSPYGYAPHFGSYFAFGNSADDTRGQKLSRVFDTTCTGREHHCTIALPETRVSDPRAAKAVFVNLVVGADDSAARSFDRMDVEDGHGMLAVTRIGRGGVGGTAFHKATSDSLRKGAIDIDREDGDAGPLGADPKVHHPIYRVKLDGIRPGDVISADAKLVAKTSGGYAACDALITTEIVLTRDQNVAGGKRPSDDHITQTNGQNCTDHGGACVYTKSGAVRANKDVASTMYVTLIATAGRTCVPPGYTWEVQNGGLLSVDVRRSP